MIVYKACRNSIATLELLEDSITNEDRKDVVNSDFAKFRTNKVKVVEIVNVKTGKRLKFDSSIHLVNFIYEVGKVVETNYCSDINKVCAEGIHYFKTCEVALSWYYDNNRSQRINGTFMNYYENGEKKQEENYKNGLADGLWQMWCINGEKVYEKNYKDGNLNGRRRGWFKNGKKCYENNYKDGNYDGLQKGWYKNGEKAYERNYKDGIEKYS